MVPSPRQPLNGQGVLRISGPIMKKIATWNVRSMFEGRKTHNAIREMRRLGIDVLRMKYAGLGRECVR